MRYQTRLNGPSPRTPTWQRGRSQTAHSVGSNPTGGTFHRNCRWSARPSRHASEGTCRTGSAPLRDRLDRGRCRPVDGAAVVDGPPLVSRRPAVGVGAATDPHRMPALHRRPAQRGALRLPVRAVPRRRPHRPQPADLSVLDHVLRRVAGCPGRGGSGNACGTAHILDFPPVNTSDAPMCVATPCTGSASFLSTAPE
jgi:hypothetical protein